MRVDKSNLKCGDILKFKFSKRENVAYYVLILQSERVIFLSTSHKEEDEAMARYNIHEAFEYHKSFFYLFENSKEKQKAWDFINKNYPSYTYDKIMPKPKPKSKSSTCIKSFGVGKWIRPTKFDRTRYMAV